MRRGRRGRLRCGVGRIRTGERSVVSGIRSAHIFPWYKPRTISRILAVVELAGAIDREHADLVKQIPPTLILHGSEDARVPV
jgi:predicted PhzF superfamily epimerase YddE/YHI9